MNAQVMTVVGTLGGSLVTGLMTFFTNRDARRMRRLERRLARYKLEIRSRQKEEDTAAG
jgi:hypothetical protein